MILTVKVSLPGWSCIIELEESTSFEDLHHLIQSAVEFDDDHLYEFFVSSSERSRNRDIICSYEDSATMSIGDVLPVPKGRRLLYLFDYGDNWLFRIALTRKSPFEAIDSVGYPNLVSETGERPIQYPGWEE